MATTRAKAKTVAPAKQLEELLPKITTRELYGVAVAILLEGADRAENYADAAWADGAPREVADEGLAFVSRFLPLWRPTTCADRGWLRLQKAQNELQGAWSDDA